MRERRGREIASVASRTIFVSSAFGNRWTAWKCSNEWIASDCERRRREMTSMGRAETGIKVCTKDPRRIERRTAWPWYVGERLHAGTLHSDISRSCWFMSRECVNGCLCLGDITDRGYSRESWLDEYYSGRSFWGSCWVCLISTRMPRGDLDRATSMVSRFVFASICFALKVKEWCRAVFERSFTRRFTSRRVF